MLKLAFISLISMMFFTGNSSETPTEMNQNESDATCSIKNDVYDVGEKLTYKVYYNWTAVWMSAGKATFDIKAGNVGGKEALHIVSKGITARSFDWFFKVRDQYETYLDPQTIKPLKFVRSVKEGDYTKENLFTFDHNNNEAMVHYRKRMGKVQAENEKVTIPSCTQDLLSAIYYTRCIDYETMAEGDIIPVELFLDGEMYSVHLRYKGKDKLKHNRKWYNCVKFSPLLLESDTFDGGEAMTIWATDDDNRLPLLIESPLTVGSVKAYLIDYEGLKHDVTSLR